MRRGSHKTPLSNLSYQTTNTNSLKVRSYRVPFLSTKPARPVQDELPLTQHRCNHGPHKFQAKPDQSLFVLLAEPFLSPL